jgi:hypothetical protein
MMHTVQEAVWSVDRGEVFWVFGPLAESFEQHTYAAPEFGATLSGPLAGIALMLVVIGVRHGRAAHKPASYRVTFMK